ncbi:benzoate 4-monooxygenase cytochrome P450 [Xylariaceae sp. FL1019]|nr:benzoate 4-monooxygenase cytochrome P450 [Xylariaceae sp. FL1019]
MLEQLLISIRNFGFKLNTSLVLALVVTVALIYFGLLHPFLYGRLHHVPGPWYSNFSSIPLAFQEFSYNRCDKVLQWHRQYGPVVRIAPNEVSVCTLPDIKQVYGSSHRWAKSSYFDHFLGYGSRSVFATKSYEEHRAKRKLTALFYRATTVYKSPELEKHIQERSRALLDQVRGGHETDVYRLTDWFALDNITFLVLGPDHCTRSVDNDCVERRLLRDLKYDQFVQPFRVRFPQVCKQASVLLASIWNRRFGFLMANDAVASWCQSRFQIAANDPCLTQTHSLLRHLCDADGARSGNKKSPDLQYIAAEVLDNINAAEATVAVTATYLIWRLTESPHWQRRIRAELSRLPVEEDGSLAFEHVNNHVPSLEACLREVYRLHPASSGRAERVVPPEGHDLSGIFLPEDTIVTASVQTLHHDEEVYPRPDVFSPGRWLDQDEEEWKLRDAQLIPFGHGGRVCLGKALATMELKLLMATLYRSHESIMTPSSSAASMRQSSTHDAVPEGLKCVVRFQCVDTASSSMSD